MTSEETQISLVQADDGVGWPQRPIVGDHACGGWVDFPWVSCHSILKASVSFQAEKSVGMIQMKLSNDTDAGPG